MPEMDERTLGRAAKDNPDLNGTAIIMLTSRGMRGDAKRANEAGYTAYLTKPITPEELKATVERFLVPSA